MEREGPAPGKMRRAPRVLVALAFGLLAPIVPTVTHAGEGVAGGGLAGGVSVLVDNVPPPGQNWGYLDYFPRHAVVRQGRTVTFTWARNNTEPHTVTYVPAGVSFGPSSQGLVNRLYPGNSRPGPDADDRPVGLYLNINVRQPADCGNSPYFPGTGACSWDGQSPISSGLLFGRKTGPTSTWTVRMNAPPGTYHYFCLLHGPAMSGTIRVVPAGALVPSAVQQAAAAATQYHWATVNTLANEAKVLAIASRPGPSLGGTQVVRTGARSGRVAIDEFLPPQVHVKRGAEIVWAPGFQHDTVTFPRASGAVALALDCELRPGHDRRAASLPNHTALDPLQGCLGGELVFERGSVPSGPSGLAYSGGFYNSGLLSLPLPHTWQAQFASRGTFHYESLIHPGMNASIVVP
jgi:plastocyanin